MMHRTEKIAGPRPVPRPAGIKAVQPDRQSQAAVPSSAPDSLQSGSGNESTPHELLLKVGQLQEKLVNTNYTLKIKVDPETGKNLVKVIDRETGEVLREIPDEEMLRIEASIQRMIGLFFDRQV
jgi:flagellar protein FlaG